MDGYPHVTEFIDAHGKTRYRFRRSGKSRYLKGEPGSPEFEESYQAALEGRQEPKPKRSGPAPKTFGAAWRLVEKSAEWKKLDGATQLKNIRLATEFLDEWRDFEVADLRRRHVRTLLSDYSDTPHKAKHMLTMMRRMIREAMDQDWIEFDPTAQMRWRPEYGGWRAWTLAERQAFEARWPYGSMPRAVYALALWAGERRSELATQLWADVDFDQSRITVRQIKTTKAGRKTLTLPMLPMLRKALEPLPRRAETVITTEYGKPFSEKSLTGMMAHWTTLAEMKPGATLHGLRKTLGKYLAEEGATAKQAGGILGHDDLDHVELYSRDADQLRLAEDGLMRLLKYDDVQAVSKAMSKPDTEPAK